MASVREQIIDAIVSRLAIVRTTNGYQTSAGASVFRAKAHLATADLPALVVWPGVETAIREYGRVHNEMPVRIEAFSVPGSSDFSEASESLLSDVIEAMTCTQYAMAYTSGGTTAIAAGNTITGATSGATGYVQSVTLTSGTWAGGDAAGVITFRRKTGTFSAENLNVGAATNLATINGTVTASKPDTTVCASLSTDIEYTGGGQESYPEDDDTITATTANFTIRYTTKVGNPFTA